MTRDILKDMGFDSLGVIFVLTSLSGGVAAFFVFTSDGQIPFWEAFFFLLAMFSTLCAALAFLAGGICIVATRGIDYKKHTAFQLIAVMLMIGIVVAPISWEVYNTLRYPPVTVEWKWVP